MITVGASALALLPPSVDVPGQNSYTYGYGSTAAAALLWPFTFTVGLAVTQVPQTRDTTLAGTVSDLILVLIPLELIGQLTDGVASVFGIEIDPRAPRYIETVYGVGYRFARE